jgi:hypothetical protein
MLALGADPEASAAAEVVLLRSAGGGIVDADIEQVDAGVILRVEAPHVRERPGRLHDHRDAVQLVVSRVKDVPAQTAALAPKCLSNAFTRSPATACGLRPSI